MSVPEPVAAIARLLVLNKRQSTAALSLDGYVRILDAIISTDGDETATYVAGQEREA